MRGSFPILLTLLACGRCGDEPDSGDSGAPLDSGDTGDSADTEATLASVSGVSSTLDEDFETLLTVSWQQEEPATAWVEARVGDEAWLATPALELEQGPATQLVLGLPYEQDVVVRVANQTGQGVLYSEEHYTSTGPLPDAFPPVVSLEGDAGRWDPDSPYLFLSFVGSDQLTAFAAVVDRQGRAVWARENTPLTVCMHPRISWDGTQLLIDESTFWSVFDGGAGSKILRMHIDGTVVETVETPGLHHPFTDLPDGSLAWGAHTEADEELVVRGPDGTTEVLLGCRDFQESHGFEEAWCGSNTLWYDAATDRFLYSLYSSQAVLEVERSSGEVTRWFGHLDGAWGFSPEDSAFWWQHGAHLTAEGTLLLSSEISDGGRETVVREYDLDSEDESLALVWSFGEGEGIYAHTMGEAHRLPGGNTLHNYGSATRIREVTPQGDVVWDADWDAYSLGRSEPLGDLYALVP